MTNKKLTTYEKLQIGFVGAVIIFALILMGVFSIIDFGLDTGKGKQAGYIAEIEESGIFWKPPDVRLLNIVTTMSSTDTSWHYGIEPELKETALHYTRSNEPVEVEYEVRRFTLNWEYSNRVVIVGITPLNNTK